ncbi:histone family protein [Candidatus Woesearchaeota archaeon]|nr:histone family protein [Candidatus Woesearchaeota archaeon]
MPRPGSTIPRAPVARIMQKAGAKRVSEDAVGAMVDYLTDYATSLGEKAVSIAGHSGRKTVQAKDLELASK